MFTKLIDWYLNSLDTGGYPLIALLMAIESSILPLPSELVIPPAAHLAHTKDNLSMTGIVIAGTIGSLIGADLCESEWNVQAVQFRPGLNNTISMGLAQKHAGKHPHPEHAGR